MRYCKAYLVKDLRQFKDWNTLASEKATSLNDDDVAYITEDFTVTTNGLEMDREEDHLLKGDNQEWKTFCQETLKFEVPDWEAESAAVREALANAESN